MFISHKMWHPILHLSVMNWPLNHPNDPNDNGMSSRKLALEGELMQTHHFCAPIVIAILFKAHVIRSEGPQISPSPIPMNQRPWQQLTFCAHVEVRPQFDAAPIPCSFPQSSCHCLFADECVFVWGWRQAWSSYLESLMAPRWIHCWHIGKLPFWPGDCFQP